MTSLDRCYQIIRKPVQSEKGMSQTFNDVARKVYHFDVPCDANKVEIRDAVEKLFKVKVLAVNTSTVRGKYRRRGWTAGATPTWKRARVTLGEGSSIDVL